MATFRSPQRPAHTVELGRLKFVAGRLQATGYDAETVRIYARAHPEVGIIEIVPPARKRRGEAARAGIVEILGPAFAAELAEENEIADVADAEAPE
jgi:hypothetical protein